MPSISTLLYGKDPGLLASRRLILQAAGCDVRQEVDLRGIARSLSVEYQIFVLCHSLSGQECAAAVELGRRSWPKMKNLILTTGMPHCSPGMDGDILDTSEGPGHLIEKVKNLVESEDLPDTHHRAIGGDENRVRLPVLAGSLQ